MYARRMRRTGALWLNSYRFSFLTKLAFSVCPVRTIRVFCECLLISLPSRCLMNFDWKNMETYQYFVAGGAAVGILAILGYFFSAGKVRLPAIIAASLSFLVVGV